MIATLSAASPNTLGFPSAAQMASQNEDSWRHSYSNSASYPVNQWAQNPSLPLGGMPSTELRMFHGEGYNDAYSRPLASPQLSYTTNDTDWASDYDVRSPSANAFAGRLPETYSNMPTSNPNSALLAARSQHSPSSSLGSISPQAPMANLQIPARPPMFRAHTAPNGLPQSTLRSISHPLSIKSARSDVDEAEYGVSEENKLRGRKRQRIPHTAVERRYREALNAGIKSLQMAVAASKETSDDSNSAVDEKPSKSTILHSAIEQIQTLSSENTSLKGEVRALRARLDEFEKWVANSQTAGNFGGKY